MRVMLGGKFESAVIREMDALNIPDRNRTTHPYYLCLNRRSDRSFFERAATFLAIADETAVPSADWSDEARGDKGIAGNALGVHRMGSFREWDEHARAFAAALLDENAFAPATLAYVAELDVSDLDDEARERLTHEPERLARQIAEHYLCRLFLQVREAGGQDLRLVLDERDIALLAEAGAHVAAGGTPPAFQFPDLRDRVVLGHDFAGGLFNFSPRDAASVAAIRDDETIKAYAARIRPHLVRPSSLAAEQAMLAAMRDTYGVVVAERRVDKILEVASWLVKPLHYIPGVDAALTIAEDIKDAAAYLLDDDREEREWHLLAVRAAQVNIEEYLARKANL